MANSLLSGRCLPSEVRSATLLRNPLHLHAPPTGRACRPFKQQIDRSTKVQAHATEAPAKSKARPGEKKGFVEEMRFVAMKLHTKDQAPKEGGKAAAPQPFQKWQPTREGYLKFLVESKLVYDALEQVVQEASVPEYALLQKTGLERAGPLSTDIDNLTAEYNLQKPEPAADGPGSEYAKFLKEVSQSEPQVFICHFYNTYFAHTAGGRMIGSKVSQMILDNKQLNFYKYDSDVKELLNQVRDTINQVAEGWTREQKDKCLDETEKAFAYSSSLLKFIASSS
ncbi:Heme oxygenase 1 [Trebouxia sp. C0009 RCD-2024]